MSAGSSPRIERLRHHSQECRSDRRWVAAAILAVLVNCLLLTVHPGTQGARLADGSGRVCCPVALVRASARSFMARSACKYLCVVSTCSCPNQSALPSCRRRRAGAASLRCVDYVEFHVTGTATQCSSKPNASTSRRSPCGSAIMRVILSSASVLVCRELGHDACASRRSSRPLKIFRRPTWPLSAASSRWRWRVGRNSCVVWK
jgi:hypothetical protein